MISIKDIFRNNRLIIVSSILSIMAILTIVNDLPIGDMLLLASFVLLASFASLLSPLLIGIALVALEAFFIFYATQEFFIPISQVSQIDPSYQTYWYAAAILTIFAFVLLPAASILIYRYGNGRFWINILLMITTVNSLMLLGIFSNDSTLLITLLISGIVLGSLIILFRSLYLRKKYYKNFTTVEFKNKNQVFKKYFPSVIVDSDNQYGLEVNKGSERFLIHLLPKNVALGIDNKQVYINNKYIYNSNIEKMLSYSKTKNQRLLVVHEEEMVDINEVKYCSPLKPDRLLGIFYIMGINKLKTSLSKTVMQSEK
jgi:hypothetical protein